MSNALNSKGWLSIILLAAAGVFATLSVPRFEGDAPRIIGPATLDLGNAGATLSLKVLDEGTGLRSVQMRLVHGGGGQELFSKEFGGDLLSVGDGGMLHEVSVELDPKALRLADGSATVIVTARDRAWQNLGDGNRSEVGIKINVDTKPPSITTSNALIYVYRGGAAAATYRVNEIAASDGIRVGERLYRGYPAPGHDPAKGIRIAFFAVPVHATANPKIELEAIDHAGNRATTRLRTRVFERNFPEERLSLSSRFLDGVIPPLAEKVGVSAGTNVESFQVINRDVRKKNEERIQSLIQNSDSERHWTKSFTQLAKSKVMSRFAEQRRYFTGEREISQAFPSETYTF